MLAVRLRSRPESLAAEDAALPVRSTFWFRPPAPPAGSSRWLIQEAWRKAGVNATVTTVEFPVFQERLAKGRFDSYIGAYLDEPSPRRSGRSVVASGLGSAELRQLRQSGLRFAGAGRPPGGKTSVGPAAAGARRWIRSTPTHRRSSCTRWPTWRRCSAGWKDVKLDPYSWLSGLREWRDRSRSMALGEEIHDECRLRSLPLRRFPGLAAAASSSR